MTRHSVEEAKRLVSEKYGPQTVIGRVKNAFDRGVWVIAVDSLSLEFALRRVVGQRYLGMALGRGVLVSCQCGSSAAWQHAAKMSMPMSELNKREDMEDHLGRSLKLSEAYPGDFAVTSDTTPIKTLKGYYDLRRYLETLPLDAPRVEYMGDGWKGF